MRANAEDLNNNLKLQGRPIDLQEKVKEVVTEYWGVFCEDGFRRPIRVFSFNIDTGNHTPIWYKPPRYGPNESEVMQNIVVRLDENVVVEEDDGPWLALVVLASKPHKKLHCTSTSGYCVCSTVNWTSSFACSPYTYLDVMMRCRTLTQKKNIWLQLIWTVGIGK